VSGGGEGEGRGCCVVIAVLARGIRGKGHTVREVKDEEREKEYCKDNQKVG
jgi:hypothetical protein